MSWNTSNRRQRLPKDWATIRTQVRDRAHNKCQATHHAPNCNRIGTDCDHIKPGDNHNLTNLQWLSHPCHQAKTAAETTQRNIMRGKNKKHPTEKLPGLLT